MSWVCKNCGKCCLSVPCVFAQARYRLTSTSVTPCPELVKEGELYKCLLIERDPEVREILLSGDCDDPELAHLKKKFDVQGIVREYFPGASDDDIEGILWGHTGYPEFWSIPRDGWTPMQCLRKQLAELAAQPKVVGGVL